MKSIVTTRFALAVATAMLLTTAWGTSSAIADEEVRSEKVKFSDLNVDSPDGAKALYGRIHAAAKRVCADRDPMMQPAEIACTAKAEGNAIGQLDLPQLSAYYQSKTKNGDRSQRLVAAR